MFQSLIGTIQTINSLYFHRHEDVFQSLIGTIQTKDRKNRQPVYIHVSIPHRYDTNFLSIARIPLSNLFQSLIGTIQTRAAALARVQVQGFNPS